MVRIDATRLDMITMGDPNYRMGTLQTCIENPDAYVALIRSATHASAGMLSAIFPLCEDSCRIKTTMSRSEKSAGK